MSQWHCFLYLGTQLGANPLEYNKLKQSIQKASISPVEILRCEIPIKIFQGDVSRQLGGAVYDHSYGSGDRRGVGVT